MKRTFTAQTGKPVKMIGIYLEISAAVMSRPPKKKINKNLKTSLITTVKGLYYQ